MASQFIQQLADRIAGDIQDQHELDEFFAREVIGVMFRDAIINAHRENVIVNVDAYLQQFCASVKQGIETGNLAGDQLTWPSLAS